MKMYINKYHEENLENKSFLVTGGAGFIGSHIVSYLLKNGAGKVRVLDNLVTGRYSNIQEWENHPNFEFIEGDITDTASCLRACEGIDYLSHQAALGSVPRSIKDPARTNATNVDGFLNMMIAAKDSKVKKIVFASSSSVYGTEKSLPKFLSVGLNLISNLLFTKSLLSTSEVRLLKLGIGFLGVFKLLKFN